jgi:hypothetical protein
MRNTRNMLIIILCLLSCGGCVVLSTTQRQYLSGKGPGSTTLWDFYCTAGRQSGQWTTIRVPSQWEQEGFGSYNYGQDKKKSDEQGRYRKTFRIPETWSGKRIRLVFEGVMTDTAVRLNGIPAGELHQGGFYEFSYEITDRVKFDKENLLEVDVSKVSSNPSVEDAERKADYWVFGGIFRAVYLEAIPAECMSRTAIDARADGQLRMDVYLDGISTCDTLTAQILDDQGKPVGPLFSGAVARGQTQCTLRTVTEYPELWTAETPNLYTVRVDLKRHEQIVHTLRQRFGFRTFQVRKEGLFVNGSRVLLKGINRHSFRPATGRCLSAQDDIEDVRLLKSMNMNAVRCSHYPPNKTFLDTCDELGLYVLDELAGWQKPPYDTAVGKKLVKELVIRDVNHPCILFWNNGNEGGWNTDLDSEFALYDPQSRPVLHPWEIFSGIDTDHYETYDSTVKKLKGPSLFMPTEFLHGLYDGGHGAGLADYWSAIRSSPFGAGGFLWVLADEGVVRTDLNGKIDTAGNLAPDGLVGPYHQKEASFYTVRQIWSPVQIMFDEKTFDGTVRIENAYDFTNLDQVPLTWQGVDFACPLSSDTGHKIQHKGTMQGPDLKPGQQGQLRLDLPDNWRSYDGLYLTATDAQNCELWTWSLPLKSRQQMAADDFTTLKEARFDREVKDSRIKITTGKYEFVFGSQDGLLRQVISDGQLFAFANGPRRVPAKASDTKPTVIHSEVDGVYVLRAEHSSGLDSFVWTIFPGGQLMLEYAYSLEGDYDYFGVTFDLPESSIQSMRWLGQGPCHVWKNRLQGGRLDVWQRDYNRGIPGYVWDYPVFSGCYADMYWLDLQTREGAIRVLNEVDGLYFRVGALQNGPDPKNAKINPIDGDLSFLHAISPIGNKFHKASDVGPSSQLTTAHGIYKGRLKFQFEQ